MNSLEKCNIHSFTEETEDSRTLTLLLLKETLGFSGCDIGEKCKPVRAQVCTDHISSSKYDIKHELGILRARFRAQLLLCDGLKAMNIL